MLAPGLTWLGNCFEIPYRGSILHSYGSLYVLSGEESSMLVDTGMTNDAELVDSQLDQVLADTAPLRYAFATHQETPHAGGLGRTLDRFPDVELVGNVLDYHLTYPEFEHRFRQLEIDDALDLGGTEFRVVEAVIADLPTTRWGFASRQKALFTADGFAYGHHHRADQCGMTSAEVPALEIQEMAAIYTDLVFGWLRIRDMEPFVQKLERLCAELGVEIVAPCHGLPVTNLDSVLPQILESLRSPA